ncbi:type II secretion system protein GspE [Kluyvera sp. 142486]|uniref:type II secretion system protein GspE n=1 Tax=Kluyvera sp. 142486 TaxID=3390050 RepID=UPI00398193DF
MKHEQLLTLCQRHHALLLNNDIGELNIAVVGAPPGELLEALRFATQKRVDIECWDQERMDKYLEQNAQKTTPTAPEESDNVVVRLDRLLKQALSQRASDIHLEPSEHYLRIRLRVDGVLHALPTVPLPLMTPLIARLKVLGNLDIAERRLPQDGQFTLDVAGKPLSFRISTLPCRYGEKVVLRLLHKVEQALDLQRLGMSPEALTLFQSALAQPQGLILVTGPTGSGKTVTLYSALQSRNKTEVNICSVEDPIEIPLDGLNQTQVSTKSGLTFQNVLRSLLRQDPDIVMVGEIRDGETAEIAIKAAQTGHLVLSTLHTNSTVETLIRLEQMGVARWMVSSALVMVVAQRLVRKLCPHCRQKTTDEHSLPRALWPRQLPHWAAPGCQHCYGGYQGRLALFEVLPVTAPIRQVIANGVTPAELMRHARLAGMSTLFESGCLAVEQGQTTQEELFRILGMPKDE